jgi:hypothetical protein
MKASSQAYIEALTYNLGLEAISGGRARTLQSLGFLRDSISISAPFVMG